MYIDANVFIHAELDPGQRGEQARKFLATTPKGTLTSTLALQEVLHVLRKHKRKRYESTVKDIQSITPIRIVPLTTAHILAAAKNMDLHGLDSADAAHLAIMEEHSETEIISDDTDFDRITGITRVAL